MKVVRLILDIIMIIVIIVLSNKIKEDADIITNLKDSEDQLKKENDDLYDRFIDID